MVPLFLLSKMLSEDRAAADSVAGSHGTEGTKGARQACNMLETRDCNRKLVGAEVRLDDDLSRDNLQFKASSGHLSKHHLNS